MKKLLVLSFFTLSSSFFTFGQTGTWTALTNLAPDSSNGLMLLLTDGTVMCSTNAGPNGSYGTGWNLLTPDAKGSYVNGTWTVLPDMHYDRFAFSSQVLPSGKVYVAGGEYGAGGAEGGEVYDPVTNTWTDCGAIPTNWNIYDAPSELLYTGNVLEGPEIGANGGQPCNSVLQWNPNTLNYINENEEPGNHDEAAWLKLPDSSVIQISMPVSQANSNPAQDSVFRYIPQTNTWVPDNLSPNNEYDQWGFEAGGAYLLPNGKAIFFGATQYNSIYTPSGNIHTKGTWTAAANFPQIGGKTVSQPDAPGAMMVNGHILLCVSPEPSSARNEFNTPAYFIEYDYTTNTFTQVTANLPIIGANNFANCISQNQGLLDLPDGTVLMCSNAENNRATNNPEQYYVYTPGSAAIPQGKPTINSVAATSCTMYKITGKLFNGISEGTGYGDDIQNSTNYPLVRITDGTNVYYAKTTNWNRLGAVMTDSLEDTAYFTFPKLPPAGTYSLVVVANGFASNPTIFVYDPLVGTATSTGSINCAGGIGGNASATATGGHPSYTYQWSKGSTTISTSITTGPILSAGTYTLTVTDSVGCTSISTITITQPPALSLTQGIKVDTAYVGPCNGAAWVTVSGGTKAYSYVWSPSGATTDTIGNQCKGSYCCNVTDKNGCKDSICITVSAVQNISNPAASVSIYPNPGNGIFTIETSGTNDKSIIEVYNIIGQQIFNKEINGTINQIDLTSQSQGLYFYRVIANSGNILGRGETDYSEIGKSSHTPWPRSCTSWPNSLLSSALPYI